MTEAELAAGAAVVVAPDAVERMQELRERETYLLLNLSKLHLQAIRTERKEHAAALHALINAALNRLYAYNIGTK